MFSVIYLIAAILCIWGSCLVARLVGNRLELGLFRRKLRLAVGTTSDSRSSPIPTPKRRSIWWTLAALLAILIGTAAAFLAHGASTLSDPTFQSADGWIDSLLVALLIASLGLAAGLALVGFRFDPSLGRRRCPKCWYDLSATKGLLCPECGHEASTERRLYRTRRSRVTIAFAIVPLLVGPIVMRGIAAYRFGWVGLVPTTIMVLAWNYLPESVVGSSSGLWGGVLQARGTLLYRIDEDEVASWQRAIASWKGEAIIRSSDDPRLILLAISLHGNVGRTSFATYLPQRLPSLIAHLNDPDPATRGAAATLIEVFAQSNENSQPVSSAIYASKGTLMALATAPADAPAFAALQLLSTGDCFASLNPGEVATFEAILSNPTTSVPRRHFTILAFRTTQSATRPILDMLLRLLDTEDLTVRSHLYGPIFRSYCDDPEILQRALRAIREELPGLAAIAASAALGVNLLDAIPSSEARDAILTRFGTDPAAAPALWRLVMYAHQRQPLDQKELDLVRPAITRALNSRVAADVQNAIAAISATNDQSPELLDALDFFVEHAEPTTPQLSTVKALRSRLFPNASPLK